LLLMVQPGVALLMLSTSWLKKDGKATAPYLCWCDSKWSDWLGRGIQCSVCSLTGMRTVQGNSEAEKNIFCRTTWESPFPTEADILDGGLESSTLVTHGRISGMTIERRAPEAQTQGRCQMLALIFIRKMQRCRVGKKRGISQNRPWKLRRPTGEHNRRRYLPRLSVSRP